MAPLVIRGIGESDEHYEQRKADAYARWEKAKADRAAAAEARRQDRLARIEARQGSHTDRVTSRQQARTDRTEIRGEHGYYDVGPGQAASDIGGDLEGIASAAAPVAAAVLGGDAGQSLAGAAGAGAADEALKKAVPWLVGALILVGGGIVLSSRR